MLLDSWEDLLYPPRYTLYHVQTSQKAYTLMIPSMDGYPYTYMPRPVRPSLDNELNSRASLTNSILVLDLDDMKEQGKLKKSSPNQVDDAEAQRKYNFLEERLNMMKGINIYEGIDVVELSLVTDLVISPKFMVLDFAKYSGTNYPSTDFTMYYRKMA